MTNFLRYTSLSLIFLATFIPLYVNNRLFFPFITGKAFAFRIIIEIVFALWLLLVIRDKKYAPKFSWLTAIVTGFTIVVLIADLFGLNPIRSIWSNFERMEGWLAIVHLWAFYIVTTSIFGTGEEGKRMWHNFFRMSLFSATIVGIYGLVQFFGGAEIHQGSSRIDASLGNAAYMAVYMLGHAFLAFYMALVEGTRRNPTLVWIYGILGVFFGFLLFETSTRGTTLGLVGGLILALIIFILWGKKESTRLRWTSGVVILIFVAAGFILVTNKDANWVKGNQVLYRLATISLSATGQARQYIWPMAVKSIFENPKTALIGVGQENFNYIFNSHYEPKMWSQEQWFDRAHSVFLDWLVAGGLVGLILYVSLFIVAIRLLWKSNLSFAEKAIMTGLFVGYGIHNIAVFDNIASYILFFTLLGYVHSVTAERPISFLEISDKQSEEAIVVRDWIYFPIIAIAFFAALYFVNIRPLNANKALIGGLARCPSTQALESYRKALKYNEPMANQEIREQLLSCAANAIGSDKLGADVKKNFYDEVLKETDKQIKATPNDARIYTLAGVFFNNIRDWSNAEKSLMRSLELSPMKQSTMNELAMTYLNTNKKKEAHGLLEKAYFAATNNENARNIYAASLVLNDQESKAKELFGSTPEIFGDSRVVSAYVERKEYVKVIEIYKGLITKNPQNIQYYGSLARAYLENGQKSLSLSTLKTMKEKFPAAAADIDAAIKEVENK